METNKRLFRFLTYDHLKGLMIFWLVMTVVNIMAVIATSLANVNLVLGPMIRNGEVITFAGANIFSLFIYFIVYGLIMYHESFSLTAGFGVTRKNFYLNVIVNNILIVLVSSVIQIILIKIDNYVVSRIGFNPMTDYGLFNINDSAILNILKLSFILLIFVSVMNLLGILQYRFGYKLWIGVGLFIVFTSLANNPFSRFVGRSVSYFSDTNFSIDLSMWGSIQGLISIGIITIVLTYLIGFLLTRRVNVK